MSKGSEWGKWDLHAHTPLDHEWINRPSLTTDEQKKQFAKSYIDFAKIKELSTIGIVDHNFCNNLNESLLPSIIIEAKRQLITILPGFEITAKDGSGIHILVLFEMDTNLQKILDIVKSCFNPGIDLCPSAGVPVSALSISEIKDRVNSSGLDSIFIFAHADSNNGVLDKKTIDGSRRIDEWNNANVNICQLSKSKEEFNDGTFLSNLLKGNIPDYKRDIAYILSSDCRTIDPSDSTAGRFHLGERFTWIKANPTFEGLKQIIYEPELRVKVQPNSPYADYPKAFFSKIVISNRIDVFGNNKLYLEPSEIELNRDLVAIIGGRGSGKSILLDHILKIFNNNESAVRVNTRIQKILNSDDFKIAYTKTDNTTSEYLMSAENYLNYVHISQSEVKRIIEEPDQFSKVIFDMLSISSEIDKEILVDLTDKVGIYLSKIDALSRYKIEEIKSNKYKYEKFIEDLKNKENQALLDEFQKNEAKKTQIEKLKNFNNTLVTDLRSFEISTNEKLQYAKNTYYELTNSIITISEIQIAIQAEELNAINETINQVINQLNEQNEDIKKKFQEAGFMQDISVLTSQLIDYERQLTQCMDELEAINQLLNDIAIAKQNIKNSVDLFKLSIETKQREMNEKWTILKTSSDPVQQEIKSALSENIILNSTIRFDRTNFYSYIDQHINGQRFRSSGGRSKIDRIQNEIVNLQTLQDFLNLINGEPIINVGIENNISIYDFIEKICPLDDILYDTESKKNLFISLISNIEKIISLNAEVTIQDGTHIKAIDELSAGMKGTLYTKVKLLTNAFETPVIFDQPEDDLDNDFIMNNMVTLFRKLKKYRQIIIVTHNPNLVINADTEQVIIANNENEHISYKSGAIENKEIRERICQILEGGENAFKKREQKYNI